MLDVPKFVDGLHGYIARALRPVGDRLSAIEQTLKDLPPVRHGKDGAPGVDGKNGEPGKDGADGRDGADGKDGLPGRDGKDGSPGINGKDGADGINGKDGAPGVDGKDGAPGADGKNGIQGLKGDKGDTPTADDIDAVISRHLPGIKREIADGLHEALTKRVESAIETKVNEIVLRAASLVPAGRDGLPGRDGAKGEDGKPGRDGADGFSIEDISIESRDEGREIAFILSGNDRSIEKVCRTQAQIYRGVYEKKQYLHGDNVTFGGSMWTAKRDTEQSPPGDDWQLCVRRGRDARPGQE